MIAEHTGIPVPFAREERIGPRMRGPIFCACSAHGSSHVPSAPAGAGSGIDAEPGTALPATPLTDCVENANVSCANAMRSLLTSSA